jgi:hypothetical protein
MQFGNIQGVCLILKQMFFLRVQHDTDTDSDKDDHSGGNVQ